MAKGKKRVADSGETGADLSFVRDHIEKAIDGIQRRARDLPAGSHQERRIVKAAVVSLKLTAAATKLHCGPRWFFLAR
jgi:hypothetical protein